MTRYLILVATLLTAIASALPSSDHHGKHHPRASWPYAPFITSGKSIVNSQGNVVTYAGVNWPGAADAMIPEGLQYQSISTIVGKIKSLGMNVIRLTYAIEMIDDIYSNNPNSTLQGSLINALGSTNGTRILNQILSKNPQFTAQTTRLQVFDAVAAECNKQQIYVHLDNHMSKGKWCCSVGDGNGWFGDTEFNTANWKRGLAYMATHVKQWPALTSMALRNELRDPGSNSPVESKYGWQDWYPNVVAAANGINNANPSPLIFFSGLNFDTDLRNVTRGYDLGNGEVFNVNSFSYANKVVYEIHNYNNGLSDSNCNDFGSGLEAYGYDAMVNNKTPVVLTEFGFPQDSTTWQKPYPNCIKQYLTSIKGGWMQWVLSGSYYIREGGQDYDETWGLLDHQWANWRSSAAINNFTIPFVKGTIS